jgi:hypothetical protein
MLGMHLPQFSKCSCMSPVCSIQICCIRSVKVLVLAGGCRFSAKKKLKAISYEASWRY